MELSARNIFEGKVVNFSKDNINAQVFIKLKGKQVMVAAITSGAVEKMQLEDGMEVKVLIKAPEVIISTHNGDGVSARNILEGRVESIKSETINSEIILDLGNGTHLVSIISTDSLKRLGLSVGQVAYGIVKSSCVMLGKAK